MTTSPSYIEARDFPPFNTFSIHCRVQWSLNITANITVEWTINDQSVGPLEGHSVNIEREDKEILAVLNISNGSERHFVYKCVAKISVWREEEEEEEFYGESEVIIYGKREGERGMRDVTALLYYSGYIVSEFNFVLIACKMNIFQRCSSMSCVQNESL